MKTENVLWTKPLGPTQNQRTTLFVVSTAKTELPNAYSMAKIRLNSKLVLGKCLKAMVSRLEHVQGKGWSIVSFDGSRGKEYSINTRC